MAFSPENKIIRIILKGLVCTFFLKISIIILLNNDPQFMWEL